MVSFGDGLFETCYAEKGRIRFWADHRQRMEDGLARLRMAWSSADRQALEAELDRALADKDDPVVCKILLGRAVAGRGYDFDPATQHTDRIIQVYDYKPPAWRDRGADLVVSDVPPSVNPVLAGIKHLNRLDSVLARQSARRAGADEALMVLADGHLVEGSMSNVFVRRSGRWSTPPLSQAGVNGIVRRRLLQQTELPILEQDCLVADLPRLEAMFICNSLIGLVPVRSLDRCPLPPPSDAQLRTLCHVIGIGRD